MVKVKEAFQISSYNPHSYLGIHTLSDKQKVIRLWRPGAKKVHIELLGRIVEMHRIFDEGLFELIVPVQVTSLDYKVYHQNGLFARDPYSMVPTFGEMDQHLFSQGVHYKIFDAMGGHITTHQGVEGAKFAVWAPNAKSVSLVGDFNYWDGRINPMRCMGGSGVWELFVPGLKLNEKYKFEIKTEEGALLVKNDPYGNFSEMRPGTASILQDVDSFVWGDQEWMGKRKRSQDGHYPMNIYELHLGAWKRKDGGFYNYRELAHLLVEYCKELKFSHIELLPINEHPFDASWGYQVTGFYAITSRFGTPADFQYFVSYLHQNNIGVIVDWVPAHFPTDGFSLSQFDGTALYEHADPRKGFHPHWNTHIFNYGRREVSNFLIGSALFLFEKMHIDGLRVDAVASMLYLDYGRKESEWIPNTYGGRENLEAIEFLKHLNSIVHEKFSGALMIAEESTSFMGVTHPLSQGGLGFDYKWNMGWMNDTLSYFQKDPLFRHYHHNNLTFGLLYAFSEKFVLVLSHDEVVHGKGSLLAKMPGDDWQKFANVRLFYSYMICQPGKKLVFMGSELGQWEEWCEHDSLPWRYLQYERHYQLISFFKKMNSFYRDCSPLWENDCDHRGFEWIDFSDRKNSVISYLRKGSGSYVACVHNFTPAYFENYFVSLKNCAFVKEIFNSDSVEFGGSGKLNGQTFIVRDSTGSPVGFSIQLAPLATMIFEVKFVS